MGRHVHDLARHPEPFGHAERPGDPAETRPLGALADQQDLRRRDLSDDGRKRPHEEIEALDRDESAEADDDKRGGIETEPYARFAPGRRRRAQLGGRHAARHRDVLRGAADAPREVLRGAPLGQGDDAVGPARSPALERGEDGGPAGTVVAVEHVAVRLVDHRRHARDHRRETADEPGLRGVRVDDRRPLAPDEPEDLRERGQVGDERHFSPECLKVDDPAATPARVHERGRIRLPEGRGQGALVSGFVERDARRDRVLRRAAQGEPGDRVEDADPHRGPLRA